MKADCCALRAPAIRDGIRTPAYRPSSSFRPLLPSPHRLAMKADCCALRAPAIQDGIRTPAYRPSSSFRPARTMPIWSCMQACAHIVAVRDFHRKKKQFRRFFFSRQNCYSLSSSHFLIPLLNILQIMSGIFPLPPARLPRQTAARRSCSPTARRSGTRHSPSCCTASIRFPYRLCSGNGSPPVSVPRSEAAVSVLR